MDDVLGAIVNWTNLNINPDRSQPPAAYNPHARVVVAHNPTTAATTTTTNVPTLLSNPVSPTMGGLHLNDASKLQTSIPMDQPPPTPTAPPAMRRAVAVADADAMPLNGSLGTFLVASGFVLFFVLLTALALWKLHARRRTRLTHTILNAPLRSSSTVNTVDTTTSTIPGSRARAQRFRIVRLARGEDLEKGESEKDSERTVMSVPVLKVSSPSPVLPCSPMEVPLDYNFLQPVPPPPPARVPLSQSTTPTANTPSVLGDAKGKSGSTAKRMFGKKAKSQGGKENALPALPGKTRTRSVPRWAGFL